MTQLRINILREALAEMGKLEQEYIQFFPRYADNLIVKLGEYLGDPLAVRLSNNNNDYNFEENYRHQGLGLENGQYRIPIQIKIRNLTGNSYFQLKVILFCTKESEQLNIRINDEIGINTQTDDFDRVCESIYSYLTKFFSKESWFQSSHYNGGSFGFVVEKQTL